MSNTITDLTGTSWEINESPIFSTFNYNIDFLSNSISYNQFRCLVDHGYVLYYDNTLACMLGTWQNQAYRTISITGGTDATNSNLISWLQANATPIIEEEPISSFNELEVIDHTNYITLTIQGNTINVAKSQILAPIISLYDNNIALKIESINNYEDEYEIYVDNELNGIYDKFYNFIADSNSLTKCLGKEYYTGEIITPQSINNTNITELSSLLFSNTVASKITISEGVTTTASDLFNSDTSTVNIVFPSTISNFLCLNSYPQTTINIGKQNYIEYAWTNTLPTPNDNKLFKTASTHTNINFYVKSTITTFNDYSLYIELNSTNTINYYFDESDSETITFGTNLLYIGTSKIKSTYNIYTDNANIKDEMLTYAGSNCTVNVYKRDGGTWE